MNLETPTATENAPMHRLTAHNGLPTSIFHLFSTFSQELEVPIAVKRDSELVLEQLLRQVNPNHLEKNPRQTLLTALARVQDSRRLTATVSQHLHAFISQLSPSQAEIFLQNFELALKADNCSASTIKNYRSDIKQFLHFSEETLIDSVITKPKLQAFLKKQHDMGLSPASIQRKLASLNQFAQWLERCSIVPVGTYVWLATTSLNYSKSSSSATHASLAPSLWAQLTARLKPKRNTQKSAKQDQNALISTPFVPLSPGIPAPSLDGSDSETAKKPTARRFQELRHQLKESQRLAYAVLSGNRSNPAAAYIQGFLFLVLFVGMGYFGYNQLFVDPPQPLAFPSTLTRPNRSLSFQGRLTDTARNPITTATDMRFRLYDTGPGTGGTLLWDSATCSVQPDQDGIFAAGLGDDCGSEISADVFSENANVWLEVEIETEILAPRQAIKSVAYALNSETLQGFPPADPATHSSVLVMNSSGQVQLGTDNPQLIATGDNFTITAETMTLETASGSDGDIVLSPDGLGEIIAESYIFAPGATLSATYAGGTALTLRAGPTATADIMRWQNSAGTGLGVIDAAGNIGVGTTDPSELLEVQGNSALIKVSDTNGNGVIFGNASQALSSSHSVQFGRTNGLGSGIFAIAGHAFIQPRGSASDRHTYFLDGDGSVNMTIRDGGNVGIGSTTPGVKLDVAGTGRFTGLTSSGTISFTGLSGGSDTTALMLNGSNQVTTRTLGNLAFLNSQAFTDLTDTPANYTSQAGKIVAVNGAANGLEFVDMSSVGTNYWNRIAGNLSPITLNDTLSATSSAATVATFTQTDSTKLALRAGGSTDGTTLNILGSGNVGIGTALPGAKLAVNGSIEATPGNPGVMFSNNFTGANAALNESGNAWDATPSTFIGTPGTDPTRFYVGSYDSDEWTFAGMQRTEAYRMQLGISYWGENKNITASGGGLDIKDNYVHVYASGNQKALFNTSGFELKNNTGTIIANFNTESGHSYYNGPGNFGIGTTSPGVKLDVAGTGRFTGLTSSGTITFSGLTADRFVKTTTGGVLTTSQYINLASEVTGVLPIANGGTNASSIGSAGSVAYSTGSAYGFTGVGTGGQVLQSNGSGAPSWVDASSVGTNYWQRVAGNLSPITLNDTLSATSSAATVATFTATGSNTALRAGGTTNFISIDASGNLIGTGTPNISGIGTISSTWLTTGTNFVNLAGASTVLQMNGTETITSGRLARLADGSAATPAFSFTNNTNMGMFRAADNQLGFSTGGSERVRIDAGGNVGIGTTSPDEMLSMVGTSGAGARVSITNTHNNNVAFYFAANRTNSNAGIGEYRSYWNDSVDENHRTGSIRFITGSNTTLRDRGHIGFYTSASGGATGDTARLWVHETGNIGINVTNPNNFRLQVAGNIGPNSNNTFTLGSSANRWANVFTSAVTSPSDLLLATSGSNAINFQTNSTTRWTINSSGVLISNGSQSIQTSSGNLTLATGSSGNLVFAPDGSGIIQFNADLLPNANGTLNLGSNGLRLDSVYANNFYQNGNQVCDNSGNCSTSGLWQNTANVFHPRDEFASIVDLALGGTSTASANVHLRSSGQAYFAGSVGIGVTNPIQALSVNGDQTTSGFLHVGSNANPTNTAAGDITATRLMLGSQSAFGATGSLARFAQSLDITSGSSNMVQYTYTFDPTNNSSAIARAFISQVSIPSSSTVNYTSGTGLISFEGQVSHGGSGTVSTANAMNVIGVAYPSVAQGGNVTNAIGLKMQPVQVNNNANFSVSPVVSNARALRIIDSNVVGADQPVSINRQVGISIDQLSVASNNTYLLLGDTSIPTGNFGIYSTTTYQSYFAGNVGIGYTNPTNGLAVSTNIGIGVTNPSARLVLADHTAATGGILFGTDTNLYRRTANILKTDDTFEAGSFNVGTTEAITSGRLFRAADGSVSTPAFSFSDDTNTGMYRGGADILRFATAGADRLTILADGNVGIGTVSPNTRLSIDGPLEFLHGTSQSILLSTNQTQASNAFINDTGPGLQSSTFIGISNTNPSNYYMGSYDPGAASFVGIKRTGSYGMDIGLSYLATGQDISNAGSGLRIGDGSVDIYSYGYRLARFTNGNTFSLRNTSDVETVRIVTSASNSFINTGGNLGLGTTNPNNFMLQIAGHTGPNAHNTFDLGSDTIRWRNVYATAFYGAFYGDGSNITGIAAAPAGSDKMIQYNNNGVTGGAAQFFYDNATNRVGIGTTEPGGILDVGGWAGKPSVIEDHTNILGSAYIGNAGSNTGRFRIGSNSGQGFLQWNRYYDGSNSQQMDSTKPSWSITMDGTNDRLNFSRSPAGNTTLAELLTVTGSGSVGIGTVSPNSTLNVIGAAHVGHTTGLEKSDSALQVTGSNERTLHVLRHSDTDGDAAGILFGVRTSANIQQKAGIFFQKETGFARGNLHFAINNAASNTSASVADAIMTINRTGNVGIGTASPSRLMQIQGATAPAYSIATSDTERTAYGVATGSNQWLSGSVTNDAALRSMQSLFLGTYNAHPLLFHTNNTERMRIAANGNVGIGTNNPGQLLNLWSTNPLLRLSDSNSTSTSDVATFIEFYDRNVTRAGYFGFGSTSNINMTMANEISGGHINLNTTGTGNVGIGITTPDDQLHVAGGSIRVGTSAAGGSYNQYAQNGWFSVLNIYRGGTLRSAITTNGTDAIGLATGGNTWTDTKLAVLANGNVGIGNNSPNYKLHVNGTISSNDLAVIYQNNTFYDGQTAQDVRFNWSDGSTYAGSMGTYLLTWNNRAVHASYILNVKKQYNGGYAVSMTKVGGNGDAGYDTITNTSTDLELVFKLNVSSAEHQCCGATFTATVLEEQSANRRPTIVAENRPGGWTAPSLPNNYLGSGNVGIGTNNPQYPLHVAGDTNLLSGLFLGGNRTSYITGSGQPGIYLTENNSGSYPFDGGTWNNLVIQARSSAAKDILFVTGTTPAPRMVVKSNGNVGIGTVTPGATLQARNTHATDPVISATFGSGSRTGPLFQAINGASVNPTFYDFYSWSSSFGPVSGGIRGQGANGWGTALYSNQTLSFKAGGYSSGSPHMFIANNGNVGIGTTSASYTKLHVSGLTDNGGSHSLCYLPTDGAVTRFNGTCGVSSIQYKENVRDLDYGLSAVMQLRPVVFHYKSGDIAGRMKDRVGLIAEEVFEHIPEVVQYNEDGSIQGIDYPNLIAVNINAIQEQQQLILSNTAQNTALATTLSSHARLHTDGTLILNGQGQYQVTRTDGSIQNSIISAAKTTSARVIAGLTNTRELVVQQTASITNLNITDTLRINGQKISDYIASIVQTELENQNASGSAQLADSNDSSSDGDFATITTDSLTTTSLTATGSSTLGSLLATDASISGTLTAERAEFGTENSDAQGAEPALEVRGTTRLAQLEAKMAELERVKAQTAEFMTATVSGTLYADSINNFDSMVYSSAEQQGWLSALLNPSGTPNPDADPSSIEDPVIEAGYDPYNPDLYATSLADLELEDDDVVLGAAALIAEKYLIVNGTATFAQGLSASQITVGSGLHLSDGIIEYMPAGIDSPTLAIQPSGSGRLDLLAGLMSLENGQVAITGSLRVAGTVEVEDTLLTDLIQPREFGNPFQVQVAGIATESGEVRRSRFEIIDESGEAVATFDSEGYAEFRGGIGIGNEDLRNDEAPAEITTERTSGIATLPASTTELIINANKVAKNSLIYVTPRGSTQNQVLYVKSQDDGTFTVAIDLAVPEKIEFNWWVVN